MSSWTSLDASGATVTLSAPELQAGQTLFSNSSAYSVLDFIGEGCFGRVARCQNLATKETIAVKILKSTDFMKDTENEVFMLEVISALNPDHSNVVKFFERFEYLGQTCLAFEMLDRCLYDLLKEQDWEPLPVNQLRPITKQLLVALDVLRDLGILHTDIKPDNIMCVNQQDQPLRIKLIDFGEAILASEVQTGMEIQPSGYRSPEVALGLPFTETIDVWGVGCVLAFLFLSDNLFPVDCDYQMMKCMVEVLGMPDDDMLRVGMYTRFFFSEDKAADGLAWRLLTPEEYTAANSTEAQQRNSFIDLPSSLDDLVNIHPKQTAAEFEDTVAFVDLLKQMLHLDGDQRISPHQALQHPFTTMSHLTDHLLSRAYFTNSCALMSVCTADYSADRVNTSAVWRPKQEGPSRLLASAFDCSPATRADQQRASVFHDDSPTTGPSERVPVNYFHYKDQATLSCTGGPPVTSYDEDPAWTFDGKQITFLHDEVPVAWTSDEEQSSLLNDKDPIIWSFDDGVHPCFDGEDTASRSLDRGLQKSFTAEASSSPGCTRKLLKRIRKLFRSLCCCCTTVED